MRHTSNKATASASLIFAGIFVYVLCAWQTAGHTEINHNPNVNAYVASVQHGCEHLITSHLGHQPKRRMPLHEYIEFMEQVNVCNKIAKANK